MIVRTVEKDIKKAIEIAVGAAVISMESLGAVVFGVLWTL